MFSPLFFPDTEGDDGVAVRRHRHVRCRCWGRRQPGQRSEPQRPSFLKQMQLQTWPLQSEFLPIALSKKDNEIDKEAQV